MLFTKRLRAGVRDGSITCSVRIWKSPHVKVGGRYRMEEGEIEIESIEEIAIQDITHELALESGFKGVIDLLKVAKHGPGDNVYLVRFHYVGPDTMPISPIKGDMPKTKDQPLFGLWKDREDLNDPAAYIRALRQPRKVK